MASPPRALRAPVALEPRIQEMDRLLRRQRKEIEGIVICGWPLRCKG